jgi:4'-phosphopantetheinyl transferase
MLYPVSDPTPRIDLWMVNLDRWSERGLDATTLDPGDHTQARRLRDAAARGRLMARRSVTRRLLADALHADPSAVAIERSCPNCHATDHGRPFVRGAAIEFSVSSCRGTAVVAISNRAVGVDVEVVRSDIEPLVFALSDDERKGVLALAPDQQGVAFLRLWTAKEAVLKAASQSVGDHLVSVDVPGLLTDDQTTTVEHGRSWRVRQLSIDRRFGEPVLVALADHWGAEVNVMYIDVPQPA